MHAVARQPIPRPAGISTTAVWTGRVLSAVAAVFLLFDAAIHIARPAPVVAAFAELGYPVGLSLALGVIELACLVVYVVPRTAVLGAILETGYLGGAVASKVRIEDPLFSSVLFGVYFGILVWGGLYLRDERLRSLIPLRHGR